MEAKRISFYLLMLFILAALPYTYLYMLCKKLHID